MIVGFMRNFKKPTYMAKLTAMLCKYQGIDLIYLRPRDVNLDENTVNGKMFINNSWESVQTDLPTFIDISPYCFKPKNKHIMRYLRNNTILSDKRTNILSKEKLQNRLMKDGEFAHLVIPTCKATDFHNIEEFLSEYGRIVLKPIRGERGKGIYVLKKEDNSYKLGYQKQERTMPHNELKVFFEDEIKNKGYMLQKYIYSRSIQGDPFDCRVHVEKNKDGEWVSARNFIRIGIGQKVVSNVNQGGGISDPEPFLRANFGDNWEKINQKLNQLAVTLPYKVEELRKTNVMSLGMDIGIDKDGKLYLFEINGAPTTAPLRSEAAILRTDYYRYILENEVK